MQIMSYFLTLSVQMTQYFYVFQRRACGTLEHIAPSNAAGKRKKAFADSQEQLKLQQKLMGVSNKMGFKKAQD